jgi:hypothetical protein
MERGETGLGPCPIGGLGIIAIKLSDSANRIRCYRTNNQEEQKENQSEFSYDMYEHSHH